MKQRTKQRWMVLGSMNDDSMLLKLEELICLKLSFKNYQFSDNSTIKILSLIQPI